MFPFSAISAAQYANRQGSEYIITHCPSNVNTKCGFRPETHGFCECEAIDRWVYHGTIPVQKRSIGAGKRVDGMQKEKKSAIKVLTWVSAICYIITALKKEVH